MVMDTVRELTRALAHLLRREHTALAEFLVALADFDRKRLWMDLGYTSLFQFLRAELHLSKAAAQYRKVAAELIQQVPAVADALRDGTLCFTTVIEVARVVTAENWQVLLPRFFSLSRRDAMELVAELQPHPAPPSRTVVTIPAPAPWLVAATVDEAAGLVPALAPATEGKRGSAIRGSPAELTIREAPAPPLRPSRPAEVVPLDADERRLHLTVSKRFLAKLAAATDALGHSHAAASEAEILEAGLDLLLAQAAKRNGLVERPQKTPRSAKPDHVPATVKRAVYLRDSGRCQYRLASGEVCGCTRRLQYDHVIPRALGGPSTVDNVRLVCAPHNLLAARLALGDEVMDRYTSNPRTREQNARRPGRPRDEHADGR
jgi:5-methylcytosine-specific restriction endonuclease McrA